MLKTKKRRKEGGWFIKRGRLVHCNRYATTAVAFTAIVPSDFTAFKSTVILPVSSFWSTTVPCNAMVSGQKTGAMARHDNFRKNGSPAFWPYTSFFDAWYSGKKPGVSSAFFNLIFLFLVYLVWFGYEFEFRGREEKRGRWGGRERQRIGTNTGSTCHAAKSLRNPEVFLRHFHQENKKKKQKGQSLPQCEAAV